MLGQNLDVAKFTLDYEEAIGIAVRSVYPSSATPGCYFHWKQAQRRKLKELGIPQVEIGKAMAKGMVDLTCMMSYSRVPAAIAYIRANVESEETKTLWDQYWIYFGKTWYYNGCKFKSWNMSHLTYLEQGTSFRTNNACESWNRYKIIWFYLTFKDN